MRSDDFVFSPLSHLTSMLRSGVVSSREVTAAILDRITQNNPQLNAFITVTPELALAQAEQSDRELSAGHDRGPLHGVPIALKDLIRTRGVRTTAGTGHFRDMIPDRDAQIVSLLRKAGAVILGKTGMDELAWGTTSNNPFYGPVRNPWRTDYHPGGSSGGSAAAVAAGLAFAAIGTDTACSVRFPAHCCGIVGFKPTSGLVSMEGVIPLVPTMDHAGPLTRTVRDAAIMLQAITSAEIRRPESGQGGGNSFTERIDASIEGSTIGVPRQYFFEGGDPEVTRIVGEGIRTFDRMGAGFVNIDFPDPEKAFKAAGVTFLETLSAFAEVIREDPSGFSNDIRRIMDGLSRHTTTEYDAAQELRAQFTADVDRQMGQCDVIVMPVSTVRAGPIGEPSVKEHWRNCVIFNFTGQPALSVPCGFTDGGLPVGLMIAGRRFQDAVVLQFGHAFEQMNRLHLRHPARFV